MDAMVRIGTPAHIRESPNPRTSRKTLTRVIEHFRQLSDEYMQRNLGLARVQGAFYPLLTLLGGASGLVVLYAGGRLVMSGSVSTGEFVAFGVYLGMLVWPMIALGWAVNLVQRGAASMGRINQLFREEPAITSPHSATVLPPAERARAVEFRDVWFRYPGAKERGWVLQEISFSVQPGASLAIVGATGSGKSTLVDLLVRIDLLEVVFVGREAGHTGGAPDRALRQVDDAAPQFGGQVVRQVHAAPERHPGTSTLSVDLDRRSPLGAPGCPDGTDEWFASGVLETPIRKR